MIRKIMSIIFYDAYDAAVIKRIEEVKQLAEIKFDKKFPVPYVSYALTGRTGGQAHCGKWEIRVNKKLMMENFDEYIRQTIPHEFAHLVVFKQFGNVKPHGEEWKKVMKVFGLQPKRCHSYVLGKSRRCPHEWKCKCQSFFVSRKRHETYLSRPARCRKCKGTLVKE